METMMTKKEVEDELRDATKILGVRSDKDLTVQGKNTRIQSLLNEVRRLGNRKSVTWIAIVE